MTARPVPVPDALSEGYWQAAAGHVLALARCAHCSTVSHPPDVVCRACGSTAPAWQYEPVSGDGVVRSWTVVRQAFLPGPEDDVPFVLVDVELDGQADLRLIGRLLDGPTAPLQVGAAVRTVFEDLAPGTSVPAFALVQP